MSGNLELPIDLRSEGEQQAAREEAAKRLKTSKYLEKSVLPPPNALDHGCQERKPCGTMAAEALLLPIWPSPCV